MDADINDKSGRLKRIRVLIADDSAVFRTALERLLKGLPQVEMVGVAEDGVHALVLVASTRPDLVLMDANMPGLSGLQATRQTRAGFPGVRVIIITLHDLEELKAASLAAGAERLILKRNLRHELPEVLAQPFPNRLDGAEERPS